MRRLYKYLIKLAAFSIFFIFFYYFIPPNNSRSNMITSTGEINQSILWPGATPPSPIIYIWCIVVKIEDSNSMFLKKLKLFIRSLLQQSKNCTLSLNVLTDDKSKVFVNFVISAFNSSKNGFHDITFYDISNASTKIRPITQVMQQYFSSVPGTYYSDSLFYLSLGLHEIAPKYQDKVILLDIDLRFETSILSLYQKFANFGEETLFGLAPELTPVYHHILWKWRQTNSFSQFGEPSYRGYSGLNSGVMLMKLDAIRKSEEYRYCLTRSYVHNITSKYFFKGHLGDQDFYTLLGMDKPHLIKVLPCTWNRQLCQWWKHHGYADVFDEFARCNGRINIYHGNCNTPIPIK